MSLMTSWQCHALMRLSVPAPCMHQRMLSMQPCYPVPTRRTLPWRQLHGHGCTCAVRAAASGQGPEEPIAGDSSGSKQQPGRAGAGAGKQGPRRKPRDMPDRSMKRSGRQGAKNGGTGSAPSVQVRVPMPAGRLTPPPDPLKASLMAKLQKKMAPWIKESPESDQTQSQPGMFGSSPEAAALEQTLKAMSPEQMQAWMQGASEQQDAMIEQQLLQLSPDELSTVLASLAQPTNDPAYWEATLLKPVMQDVLREDLGPELSPLMDKIFGPGWREADRPDYMQLPPSMMRKKVQALSPEEQEFLPKLFQSLGEWAAAYEYVGDLTTELEALQDEDERRRARRLSLRRRMAAQRAQQEAATASGAASASETDAQKEGVAGGGMGPQQQQREQQDDGEVRIGQEEEQGGQLSEQAGGEEGGASGSSGASASAGEGQVDLKQVALSAGLSEEMASLVQRLDVITRRYDPETGTGWIEEGHAGGPEMRAIKRAAVTLARVATFTTIEDLQQAGLSPAELAGAAEEALSVLQQMVDESDTLQEAAARATMAFITTQLLVQEDEQEEAVRTLPVDQATTEKLLEFAAAAESWVALQAFMDSWDQRHSDVLRVRAATLNLNIGRAEDEMWWAKLEEEMSEAERALLKLKRTAMGLPQPDPDDEAIDLLNEVYLRLKADPSGSTVGSGAGEKRKASAAGGSERDAMLRELSRDARNILPIPNWERIKTVGALDAGILKGVDELDAAGYNEEVLMKWSLHPVVGPRLMSGQPLLKPEELSPDMADLLRQAESWDMEGLDHKVETRSLAPDRKERAQLTNYLREQLRSAQVQLARIERGTGLGARVSAGGAARSAAMHAAMAAASDTGSSPSANANETDAQRPGSNKQQKPKSNKGFGTGSKSGLGGRLKKMGGGGSST